MNFDTQSRERNRAAVIWFVALTFAITWSLESLLFIFKLREYGTSRSNSFAFGGIALVAMFVPGTCALLVTRFRLSQDWRTSSLNRLGDKRYYIGAWLVPPLLIVTAMLLTVAIRAAHFDPKLTTMRAIMAAAGHPATVVEAHRTVLIQIAAALTIGPLINAIPAMGEELGWRGFLLPRLIRAGMSQWSALALSGAIWGLWHAPVILRGHDYPQHPFVGVPMFIVFCTLLGIIFGWLRLVSGSAWVSAAAHGALNAWGALPSTVLTPFDLALVGSIASLIGWIPIAAFVIWLAWTVRIPVRREEFDTSDSGLPFEPSQSGRIETAV